MDRLVTLSKIIAALEPIKGEKSLQKMVYLTEQYGKRLGYHYTWNNYGPISFGLQQEVQELAALGLITISHDDNIPVYTGPSQPSKLTPFWKEQLQQCQISPSTQQMIDHLQSLGDKLNNPLFLEVMASLDYIQRNKSEHDHLTIARERCPDEVLSSARQSLQNFQDFHISA